MPVSGRKPKPAGQAVTRHAPTHDWTEVDDVPFSGAPRLPTRRSNGRNWEKFIRDTWKDWSTMPHCTLWTPADWRFAMVTLELAALVHDGESKLATELRNREKVMGTTVDFRRDLRIRYVAPKPPASESDAAAGVTNIADYRDF